MKKWEELELPKLPDMPKGSTVSQMRKALCGKKIGKGNFRDVYVLKQDPRFVVKIERQVKNGHFANVSEWRNYIDHKHFNQLGKYLCPIHVITDTGRISIQERAEYRSYKEYPKQLPAVFTDLKYTNFGWVNGRFVCMDYANLLLGVPIKLKRVKWWGKEYLPEKFQI